MEEFEQHQLIQINMLGKFQIIIGDCIISNQGNRTQKIWNLLEYLITFRKKTVSQEELIENLWTGDDSNNPASALKNLVYRARMAFSSQSIPFAKDIIIFNRGTYSWNNNLKCFIDIEEFEKLYRHSTQPLLSNDERIDLCLKVIALYVGDFLPDSCHEQWVIPLVSYYRSIYFKCVHRCVELLMQEKRYDEIINICEKAIIIDPYEEFPHRYLILSLATLSKHTAALNHYNYVIDLFYRELGVKPSEDMRGLYREITKSINSTQTDLEIIKEDLSENSDVAGTYYCDYEIFKNLYRVSARSASRTGQALFIGLITLTDNYNQIPDKVIINDAMDNLLNIIKKSLRKGDIVSRFSATQYVIMFPAHTGENGQDVLDRVCANFIRAHKLDNIRIHSVLSPLNPIM